MSEAHDNEDTRSGGISNYAAEITVALALMIVGAVVMVSTYRLGAGWEKDLGPQSGYFPFYVALIMFFSSAVTLLRNVLRGRARDSGVFVTRDELNMVLQVLVPTTIFVVLSLYIGIYISMALFIGFFMIWHGHYPLYKTIPMAVITPIVLFIVFEVWFLVPLPKGPFEAWLGY